MLLIQTLAFVLPVALAFPLANVADRAINAKPVSTPNEGDIYGWSVSRNDGVKDVSARSAKAKPDTHDPVLSLGSFNNFIAIKWAPLDDEIVTKGKRATDAIGDEAYKADTKRDKATSDKLGLKSDYMAGWDVDAVDSGSAVRRNTAPEDEDEEVETRGMDAFKRNV